MGKRGPKPMPAAWQAKKGNPSKTRPRQDAKLDPGLPQPPLWAEVFPIDPETRGGLTQVEAIIARRRARDCWRRVAPSLGKAGYLADVDSEHLLELCMVVGMLAVANRRWVLDFDSVQNERAVRNLRAQLITYGSRFYMTPGDRANVDLGGGRDDSDRDFDRPADPPVGDRRAG